jgi:hypothetical protein
VERGDAHVQLGDFDAAVIFGKVVAVAPLGFEELRALDYDLGEVHALAGVDLLGNDVDAGAESEDESCVGPVEDEVPAGKHHLAGRGNRRPMFWHAHFSFRECKMLSMGLTIRCCGGNWSKQRF